MFHHIKGTVFHVDPNRVVLDNGGVGYSINTSFFSASAVKKGEEALFYTYLHVREDAMELYGFATEEELSCYKMLTSISGVGPKAAMAILSVVTPEKLALCVISEDEKALTKVPGVGKKLAQRIILELKDKMARESAATGLDFSGGAAVSVPAFTNKATEAAQALAVLGYTSAEVAQALKGVDVETLSLEEIIRQCLKKMVK